MYRKTIYLLNLAMVSLALALGAPLAHGQDKGKGPGDRPAGFEKGKKEGWKNGDAPPGWKKGKKEGWKGGDSPPGLEKGTKAGKGKSKMKPGEETKGQEEKEVTKQ